MIAWVVPEPLRVRMTESAQQVWVERLPVLAEELADVWGLRPTGPAWSGFWSAVWPVLDTGDRPLALKITTDGEGREHEAAALRAFDGRGAVRLVAADQVRSALLLERLDGSRTLEDHPDIDAATMIIADVLADLGGHPVPPGLRTAAQVAGDTAAGIERAAAPAGVPAKQISAALESLRWLGNLAPQDCRLVHGDCHFLNVLPSLPGEPARWAAIDPLPFAGVPELEPVAMLRNRFADAAATGDADRSLRRRVDVIADRTGMDASLARRLSQAVAVANLPYLLQHPDHQFAAPYAVMAGWI